MLNKKRGYNIDFIGKRKLFFTISLALISIIILASLVFGVLMDIQFKGGTIITYNYIGSMDMNEVDKLVEDTIGVPVKITEKQGINGADSFDITLTDDQGLNSDKQSELTKALSDKYTDKIEFISNTSVDPSIGKEFFLKSIVAVIISSIILILYIAYRFKKISGWSAGITAVIALLHDVIIVFGVFVIFRMPLDYNFIAVILTILGYSINDTIIIYDRIRENNRIYGKSEPISSLVNKSINQTMARTINTTVSTLIAMITICIVSIFTGVTSIISFAFPMIIGMISGTYSTVCIAGPLWVMWEERKQKNKKR